MDTAEKKARQRESSNRWRQKQRHPCIDCGKLVEKSSTRCWSCSNRFTYQSGKRPRVRPRGAKSSCWKGGRHLVNGYPVVHMPEHPRALQGYVREHWLVWERAHNKSLPKGWIIHHLNGIRDDNRTVNLAAMPSHKHSLVLEAKARRIQQLEALLNGQAQLL